MDEIQKKADENIELDDIQVNIVKCFTAHALTELRFLKCSNYFGY